jgi:hypothetical protein
MPYSPVVGIDGLTRRDSSTAPGRTPMIRNLDADKNEAHPGYRWLLLRGERSLRRLAVWKLKLRSKRSRLHV